MRISENDHMNSLLSNLNRKLALAGMTSAFAWIIGLYFALLPMELPGLPGFVTAGSLEWAAKRFWRLELARRAFGCFI
jgi:hypothetical protein